MSNVQTFLLGSGGGGLLIETINNIAPDVTSNFTISAGPGIAITAISNGIQIAATDSAFAYTTVNAAASPYTVLATDYYISVDSSAGAVTLNFPNAPTSKRTWVVKDKTGSAATHFITITTPGGSVLFDGSTSYVLDDNYEAVQMLANPAGAYEMF